MKTRLFGAFLAAILFMTLAPTAWAATFKQLNQPEVFVKQEQNGTCTLASTVMMLRRAAILCGDPDWASITESSVRAAIWISGCGLRHEDTYSDFSLAYVQLPGGDGNAAILTKVLKEHPEGVMLHASCVPHGVLLTDYTNGIFYCADPAPEIAEGRVPITEAHGTRVENASAYWYIVSDLPALQSDLPFTLPKAGFHDTMASLLGFSLSL